MLALKAFYSRALMCIHPATPTFCFQSRFFFCQAANPPSQSILSVTPSVEVQRAVMASSVICRIIENLQLPQVCTDKSLKELIFDLEPQIRKHQISKQVRSEIFQLFTKGIYLSPLFFQQQRIQDGSQANTIPLSKKTQQMPQKADTITKVEQKRFVFQPNFLSTRQVFKILADTSSKRSVFVTGGFGIGKTVSIVLYIQLSNYIHHYYQKVIQAKQAIDANKATEKDKQIAAQFDQLIRLETLYLFPKCWYWSINLGKHSSKRFKIQDHILEQVPELSQAKRNELKNAKDWQDFEISLNKAYKDVHLKSVIDQINSFAGLTRDINTHTYKDEFGFSFKQSQLLAQDQRIEAFHNLTLQLKHYRSYGDSSVYFSSVNIEKDILTKSNNTYMGLGIYGKNGHGKPLEMKIQFQNLLKNKKYKWAQITFWHFFWFQIERRLKEKVTQQLINQIKTIFLTACQEKEKKVKSYWKFLYIREFLDDLNLSINHQQKENQIELAINQIFNKFGEGLLLKVKQRIIDFVQKGNQEQGCQKLTYLYYIYFRALKTTEEINIFKAKKMELIQNQYKAFQIGQEEKNKAIEKLKQEIQALEEKGLEVPKDSFQQIFYKSETEQRNNIDPINQQTSDVTLQKKIKEIYEKTHKFGLEQEFLSYEAIGYDKIVFYMTPKQLQQILDDYLFSKIKVGYSDTNTKAFMSKYNSPKGFYLEFIFLQCLDTNTEVQFSFVSGQSIISQKLTIFKKSKFSAFKVRNKLKIQDENERKRQILKQRQNKKIKKTIADKNWQLSTKTNSIHINLRSVLQDCEKNPGKHIIATPIDGSAKHSQQNPSVDFIIASYVPELKSFKIYFFDLTITIKQKGIDEKINKSMFVIEDLLRHQQFGDKKIDVTHLALFPHNKKDMNIKRPKQIDYQNIQFENEKYQVKIADCDIQKMILRNNHSRKLMRNIYCARSFINLVANDPKI